MSQPASPSLLSIRGLTKRFGGLTAVSDIAIEVPERSIYAVIGPNGAGKTTLFNCITGFYQADEGSVILDGKHALQHLRPDEIARLGVTRTYQNIRLFKDLTALENVLVGMHSRLRTGLVGALLRPPSARREEVEAVAEAERLLALVDLEGSGDQVAKNLPYGDQRRLEIARALATRPRLLLLDGPTAGMNPNETAEMIAFIRRLRDELGLTVLLIEHDMKVIMSVSERITVMDFGQRIAEGLPAEIQANPRVIEAYLGLGAAGKGVAAPVATEFDSWQGADHGPA